MINAPPLRTFGIRRQPGLPRKKQPPARRVGIDLIACQQIWVALDQLLEMTLKLIRLLDHLEESITALQKNSAAHELILIGRSPGETTLGSWMYRDSGQGNVV